MYALQDMELNSIKSAETGSSKCSESSTYWFRVKNTARRRFRTYFSQPKIKKAADKTKCKGRETTDYP
jgi:hypothetical protein